MPKKFTITKSDWDVGYPFLDNTRLYNYIEEIVLEHIGACLLEVFGPDAEIEFNSRGGVTFWPAGEWLDLNGKLPNYRKNIDTTVSAMVKRSIGEFGWYSAFDDDDIKAINFLKNDLAKAIKLLDAAWKKKKLGNKG